MANNHDYYIGDYIGDNHDHIGDNHDYYIGDKLDYIGDIYLIKTGERDKDTAFYEHIYEDTAGKKYILDKEVVVNLDGFDTPAYGKVYGDNEFGRKFLFDSKDQEFNEFDKKKFYELVENPSEGHLSERQNSVHSDQKDISESLI